jgi:hypothetical protein
VGCPRWAGKPRVASLLIESRDEQQHGVGKKGIREKGVKCKFDNFVLDTSINHVPLFYRE